MRSFRLFFLFLLIFLVSTSCGPPTLLSNAPLADWLSITTSSTALYSAAVTRGGNLTGIYTSSDYGATWGLAEDSSCSSIVSSSDGMILFAACFPVGILFSTDAGLVFETADDPDVTTGAMGSSLAGSEDLTVMLLANEVNIVLTSDGGTTWTPIPFFSSSSPSIAINADTIVSCDASGVYQIVASKSSLTYYISSDSGTTWEGKSTANTAFLQLSISSSGDRVIGVPTNANQSPSPLLTSSDLGTTWSSFGSNTSFYLATSISPSANLLLTLSQPSSSSSSSTLETLAITLYRRCNSNWIRLNQTLLSINSTSSSSSIAMSADKTRFILTTPDSRLSYSPLTSSSILNNTALPGDIPCNATTIHPSYAPNYRTNSNNSTSSPVIIVFISIGSLLCFLYFSYKAGSCHYCCGGFCYEHEAVAEATYPATNAPFATIAPASFNRRPDEDVGEGNEEGRLGGEGNEEEGPNGVRIRRVDTNKLPQATPVVVNIVP